jgi:cytochrome P450
MLRSIQDLLNKYLKNYNEKSGLVSTLSQDLKNTSLNVVFPIVFGAKIDGESKEFKQMYFAIQELFACLGVGDIGEYLPWVKQFGVGKKTGERLKEAVRIRDEMFVKLLKEHRETHKPEQPRDFADIMIDVQASETIKDETDESGKKLSDDEILMILGDVIQAGTDTSASTVEWLIALLVNNPRIQDKMHEELDRVVGKDRLMTSEDQLPYLEATLRETMRVKPVGPLGVPHRTVADAVVAGYQIPQNTQILYNLANVLRNPDIWKNPHEFDPDRFLNQNISPLGSDERMVPFGTGRRVCPGNAFAMHELFLWVGRLLQCFSFSAPAPVSLKENFGLTLQPNQFDIKVTLRVAPELITRAD